MDFTAAVHVAASGQVPLRHGESRSAERKHDQQQTGQQLLENVGSSNLCGCNLNSTPSVAGGGGGRE